MLDDLAQEERAHEDRAQELKEEELRPDVKQDEERARRRLFVLQIVQPGLAGLMDGSVSTLAPVFAAAFATRIRGTRFWLAWRRRSARASAWDLPRRFRTMEALPGAGIRGCED